MQGALATTVTTTEVDVGAAAGVLIALVVLAIVVLRLVAAVREVKGQHHESCADLIRAVTEAHQSAYRTLREENARLAGQEPPQGVE